MLNGMKYTNLYLNDVKILGFWLVLLTVGVKINVRKSWWIPRLSKLM